MKEHKSAKAAYGIGIFAAIAASLCCITPVLALIAGASGLASSLSWLAPLRPFLIGIAVITLAYAWYKSIKTKNDAACTDGTCQPEKKTFLSSKAFLIVISVAALLFIAFPYYAKVFYPKHQKQMGVFAGQTNIQTVQFQLKGMTCKACEAEVNNELYKVNGVIDAKTFYNKGQSIVQYDSTRASLEQLQKAIANTGYTVAGYR